MIRRVEVSGHAKHVAGYELNLSCPNVDSDAAPWDWWWLGRAIGECVGATQKPVWVKLAPMPNLAKAVKVVATYDADAITLCNTIPAMVLDDDHKPGVGRGDRGACLARGSAR